MHDVAYAIPAQASVNVAFAKWNVLFNYSKTLNSVMLANASIKDSKYSNLNTTENLYF